MNEIWKDIQGYEGVYQVSSLGRVKSLKRYGRKEDKILRLWFDSHGYYQVDLRNDGKRKLSLVNELVAKAFIPNPENKPQTNHKNSIRSDNRVENLEWCTSKENVIYSFKEGNRVAMKGEKNGGHKLKENEVTTIRELKSKYSQAELAKKFRVSVITINRIIRGAAWRLTT